MRRNFLTSYMLLGMLLIASSCSQTDVEGGRHVKGDGIEFRSSFPELSTRASQTDASSLEQFQVSAFTASGPSESPYFEDKTFSRNGNSGVYTSNDPQCVWPDNNNVLRFVALAPSCEAMLAAGGNATFDGYRLSGIKVSKDVASQFDFVTATASGNLYDNEETGVNLNFRHQLSRIKINAWGNPSAYDIEIAGVRLGGVATEGNFDIVFPADASESGEAETWESVAKGCVEYIFKAGDRLVRLDNTEDTPSSASGAVSILGSKIGGAYGYDNSAMVIPSDNSAWQYKGNPANGESHTDGMYISVLLRVKELSVDNGAEATAYPYADDAEGMETVYLAVTDGTVNNRLYREGDKYYTDADLTMEYSPAEGEEIKGFGWAALPVEDNLKQGRIYTYTLNYSHGVGLRDPHDPQPGEPIFSDKVLIDVEVTDWIDGSKTDVSVPRK